MQATNPISGHARNQTQRNNRQSSAHRLSNANATAAPTAREPSCSHVMRATVHRLGALTRGITSLSGAHQALHYAAYSGDFRKLQNIILFPGLNLNIQNVNGESAIDLAANKNHEAIIRLLLQHGAMATSKSLDYAVSRRNFAIARLLVQHHAPVSANALNLTIQSYDQSLALLLIQHSVKIPAQSLYLAVKYQKQALINAILAKGASSFNCGSAALAELAKEGNLAGLQFFANHGVKVSNASFDQAKAVIAAKAKAQQYKEEQEANAQRVKREIESARSYKKELARINQQRANAQYANAQQTNDRRNSFGTGSINSVFIDRGPGIHRYDPYNSYKLGRSNNFAD